MNPPQEVVCQFLGGRLPEPHHATALGVHRAQDVADRPVLAPRVHPLQADQEGAPPVGVEQLLQLAQLLPVLLDLLGRVLVALVVVLEPRIDVLELYFAAGCHSEPIDIFHLEPPTCDAIVMLDFAARKWIALRLRVLPTRTHASTPRPRQLTLNP